MRNFIIIIGLLMSTVTYGQIKFVSGKSNADNKFIREDSLYLKKDFLWVHNKKKKKLLCGIHNVDEVDPITIKSFEIDEYGIDEYGIFFFCKDVNGREVVISFFESTNTVYGFYPDNNDCYFITGKGLYIVELKNY